MSVLIHVSVHASRLINEPEFYMMINKLSSISMYFYIFFFNIKHILRAPLKNSAFLITWNFAFVLQL